MRVCLCLGRASKAGRGFRLAQVYDEVCRKEWCAKAARGETNRSHINMLNNTHMCAVSGDMDFDVEKVCLRQDPELYEQAVCAYDAQEKVLQAKRGSKRGASGGCYS